MEERPGDVTRLLPAWGKGGAAEQQLFELLEPELQLLARSALRRSPDLQRKLQPEELVSEAYLRLKQYLDTRDDVSFANRRPFFKMVLKVMRHVLLDLAKRGGQSKPRTTLILSGPDVERLPDDKRVVDAYVFYETLDRLRVKNAPQAEAIELHYIAGWTLEESADLLGLSTATLKRQLAAARQWFEIQLTSD